MGEDTNFRELLQAVETALYDAADIDAAAFLLALQRAKPAFLNLLRYKASLLAQPNSFAAFVGARWRGMGLDESVGSRGRRSGSRLAVGPLLPLRRLGRAGPAAAGMPAAAAPSLHQCSTGAATCCLSCRVVVVAAGAKPRVSSRRPVGAPRDARWARTARPRARHPRGGCMSSLWGICHLSGDATAVQQEGVGC
jgi:hypothetical protein